MKTIFFILFYFFLISTIHSQVNVNTRKYELSKEKNDSTKLNILTDLAGYYQWINPDSCITYAMTGLPLSRKLDLTNKEVFLYQYMGEALAGKGNFSLALETQLKGLKLAEKIGNDSLTAWSYARTGAVYFYSQDYENAIIYFKKTKQFHQAYLKSEKTFSGFIGETFFYLNQIDSAFAYIQRAYSLDHENPSWSIPYYYLGKIYAKKGQYTEAIKYYRAGINITGTELSRIVGYNGIAEIFKDMRNTDSAIHYANRGLSAAQKLSFTNYEIEPSSVLKDIYKITGQTDSAFKYQEIMLAAKDSLYSQEKVKQMQNLAFNEQLRQQEMIAEQQAYRNRIKMYGLIVLGAIFLLISILLWRNNRHKLKANALLQQQKEVVESTLSELKSTQSQLIQSEKMASLGELTAGIAHEIQNPLNFVNNFSDVNKELIEELNAERRKPKAERDEQLENEILNDLKENEEKINHHGKRADAIVKGMLQHSRQSSGQKEPTDINKLADEYLRLSYHGLRAKDKNFNATIETDFDNSIGKINIIPQDIGRVLLNLFNNAFYAVNEQKSKNLISYQPIVSATTKKLENSIIITVSDNGNGIPERIKDKIFQPFFTTKPTGEGTGLGLSLAYDIITKEHNGTIKVKSKEGEGSEFIIQIPV